MPVCILLLFIALEPFFRKDTATLPFLGPFYHQLFPLICIILFLSLIYLARYFYRGEANKTFWDVLTTPDFNGRDRYWVLAGIFLLGFFLRFWRLDSLFDGMFWDEAYKGLDGISVGEFGERPIFLDWNAGREALIAYLIAFSQSISGYTIFAVRAVPAFAGALSVIVFYLFATKIFSSRVALISTFLFAVSKWDIILTRHGVRASLIVLFELAVLYFVALGLKSEKKHSKWFIPAGIVAGLGFYTYIAYRIFPVILLAFVLNGEGFSALRRHWKSATIGVILCLAIAAPLAKYSLENSYRFAHRMERIAVWKQKEAQGRPVQAVLEATVNTLGMFNYKGDSNARINVPEQPVLSRFASPFFLLGIVITIIHIRRRYALFLLLYFFLALLPGFLSIYSPNGARTIGCVPPMVLFTTFGILAALNILKKFPKIVSIALLTIVLSANFTFGATQGLLRYAHVLDTLSPMTSSVWGMDRDPYHVARLINQLGDRCEIILSPQFYYHSTVEYLTYRKTPRKVFFPGTNLRDQTPEGKIAIVVLNPHAINLWFMRDDHGKNFFKWWNQFYGTPVEGIRSSIKRVYRMARMSDERLIQGLRKKYPQGRELYLGSYTLYIVKFRQR